MLKTIKLKDKNNKFLEKIETISGEAITACDQCGVCSGSCPFTENMDITPSNMMRNVQLGLEQVLETETIWICASCLQCMTRCPRGLDLSKVAEALRQTNLRKAINHIKVESIDPEEAKRLPAIAYIGAFRKLTG